MQTECRCFFRIVLLILVLHVVVPILVVLVVVGSSSTSGEEPARRSRLFLGLGVACRTATLLVGAGARTAGGAASACDV